MSLDLGKEVFGLAGDHKTTATLSQESTGLQAVQGAVHLFQGENRVIDVIRRGDDVMKRNPFLVATTTEQGHQD